MTEQELQQLRREVKSLETCLQSLVVLLDESGVISAEEWAEMNNKVLKFKEERDA